MNIFGVGTSELLVILVIAMLVVGPERMVKLARDAGKTLAKFRQISESVTREFRETFSLEAEEEAEKGAEGSPTVSGGAEAVQTVVNAGVVGEVVPALEAGPPEEPAESPVSEAGQLEAELASELVDGEIEVRPAEVALSGTQIAGEAGSLAGVSMEAVAVEVAKLVPADAEVEPVDVDQVILVTDADVDDDATDREGQTLWPKT